MIKTFRLLTVAATLAAATLPLMAQAPAASAPAVAAVLATDSDDPHLWLEDVLGDKALAWVRERNAQSRKVIEEWPRFAQTRDQLRAILDSKEQIPSVVRRGDWFWNFWRDDQNPRGLWRRTSRRSTSPTTRTWPSGATAC